MATRVLLAFLLTSGMVLAEVGDPQLRTNHPWYPGELALSNFERLFKTQAEAYERVVGRRPQSDQDKALASWLWRNTHYWHGEEGAENLWGRGFTQGDLRTRDYWTGLFAHGFGLCGTTHSQWTTEMQHLLGHGRGRGVGVQGHNAFEVFLKDPRYGPGKWVLLDHDLSTVVFSGDGKQLLSIPEVRADLERLVDRDFHPEKQNGWLVCGLHPSDGSVYQQYDTAEYLAGYAGVPPMVHLRQGERLRRYLEPGLEDGQTFVFWGRNYNTGSIPGPERSRTWVNQPDKMHGARQGAGHVPGQARYANAVYQYHPVFSDGSYKEGVVRENDWEVIFEFVSPYIIGATPAASDSWAIYKDGCRNGLVVSGRSDCEVTVSVDRGQTWSSGRKLNQALDLTDAVKGHRQYWIRFGTGAAQLADAAIGIRTVCQVNSSVVPRLVDGQTRVHYQSSGSAVVSAGPNLPQAQAHVVDGAFNTPRMTMELASPRGERLTGLFASAHVASGNPPDTEVRYQIEYSINQGRTWHPIIRDWSIPRQGDEPADFWSQSFCYGSAEIPDSDVKSVRVRFHNNGGKRYLRAEVHLVYETRGHDPTRVTFAWENTQGPQRAAHVFSGAKGVAEDWTLKTGQDVVTRWVEMEPARP